MLDRRTFMLASAAFSMAAVPRAAHAASPLPQFAKSAAQSAMNVDHSMWDRQLKAYIATDASGLNRVAYARWKAAGKAELDAYVAGLEATPVSRLGRAEQFAFWVNLYNARTILLVLERYPVKSIRDINLGGSVFGRGPWAATTMSVEESRIGLDDIEHRILRPLWKDARVHYAVNCASVGCPNLQRQAFTAANTNALLDAGGAAFVAHPRGVTIDNGRIRASKIYDWFSEDFGNEAALKQHWANFAPAERKAAIMAAPIAGYDYDWSLNEG